MVTQSDILLPQVKQAHIIQRLYTSPLVSEFGALLPIKQPQGKLFFLSRSALKKYDNSTPSGGGIQAGWGNAPEGGKVSEWKFEVKSSNLEMRTQKIKTSWSLEALQDYEAMFVEKTKDEISKTLAGEITNEAFFQIDSDFLDKAKVEAKKKNINYNANLSKLDLLYFLLDEINKEASSMISMLHNKAAICVYLSSDLCSTLMSHPHFKSHEKIDGTWENENLFYVGRINHIKIFNDFYDSLKRIQEAPTSSSMLIAVKDLENNVNSSVIYSPYQSNIVTEADYNTGDTGIFVFYSYGLTMCPQHHKTNSPMLKFIEFKK